jgi:hypothetical protein
MGVRIRPASRTEAHPRQGRIHARTWEPARQIDGGQGCSRQESSAGTRHLPEADFMGVITGRRLKESPQALANRGRAILQECEGMTSGRGPAYSRNDSARLSRGQPAERAARQVSPDWRTIRSQAPENAAPSGRTYAFGWQGGSATMVNMTIRNWDQPWSLTPGVRPTTSVGC